MVRMDDEMPKKINERDDTCFFSPRQVSVDPTEAKEKRKKEKQEQDKGGKIIHSKQHPKT